MITPQSMANLKLVLIPTWLTDVMSAKQKPLRYCLDIHALSRILSENDVAFYVAINTYLYEHLNQALRNTFQPVQLLSPFEYLLPDATGAYPNESDVRDGLAKITGLINGQYALTENRPSGFNLLDILPHNEILELKNSPIEIASLNFEVQMLDIDVFGITFSRKLPTENLDKQTSACLYKTLGMLTGLYPFPEVVQSGVFKAYANISRRFS